MPPDTTLTLSTTVDRVHMIGLVYARRLAKLQIATIEDLLTYPPFRYNDYSLVVPIRSLQAGEEVTVQGVVTAFANDLTKNWKRIQKATITDDTGSLEAIWFNQPFLEKTIRVGSKVSLSGKVEWFGHSLVLNSPEYEFPKIAAGDRLSTIHTGRLVPVYPETYGVSSKWLRSRIAPLLTFLREQFVEYLPPFILETYHLMPYAKALPAMHFPTDALDAQRARKRLGFDELLIIQLASKCRKMAWEAEHVGHVFTITPYTKQIQRFWDNLPFTLTAAQQRAIAQIFSDLGATKPMNRLLEGDVGSGKTVVAGAAIYLSYLNGFQSALMAPTEILAYQHYQTLTKLLEPLGLTIELRTSSQRQSTASLEKAKSHTSTHVLVGTHALLSSNVSFENLGFVVIDEQHRFGVKQRALLKDKGINPHLLTMTATPIPRTIALTLYGELDLSYLDELPKGRKKIKTWLVPHEKREAAYKWIYGKVKGGVEQAFIVCPFIEESDTLKSVRAAKKEYEHLASTVFPDVKLALLHGKLKAREKQQILNQFSEGEVGILVSTPVVEVGIDIPNATIMMIEGADRFGLSQLHQLRGRVGRGSIESYCLLFTESLSPEVLSRLKMLETTHIGAELAERDLSLRGPGDVFGTRQHGMIKLKIASLTDRVAIEESKKAMEQIFGKDPSLAAFSLLRERVNMYTIKSVSSD